MTLRLLRRSVAELVDTLAGNSARISTRRMTGYIHRFPEHRSLIAVVCLLLSLTCNASDGGSEQSKSYSRQCYTGKEDDAPHGRLDHVKIFGTGVEPTVELNSRLCFMISPKDAHEQRLDKECSPAATTWEVLVRSTDGRIRLSAPVMHLPHEGFHMPCYRLLEPGEYIVSVYLTGVDSVRLTSQREDTLFHLKFQSVGEFNVSARPADPASYRQAYDAAQASLPVCTAQLLVESGNEGRWIDHQWHPYACNVRRITPSEARACMRGKRLLVVGDSQQWLFFAQALAFLAAPSRCDLFDGLGDRRSSIARLRCDKAHVQGPVPWIPGSEGQHIAVHRTRFGEHVAATFYGAEGNGFAVARVPANMSDSKSSNSRRLQSRPTNDWLREARASSDEAGGSSSSIRRGTTSGSSSSSSAELDGLDGRDVLDLSEVDEDPQDLETATRIREAEQQRERQRAEDAEHIVAVFVAHSNASEPLYKEWMVDHKRRGPLANENAPFDFVLASSGLHDLSAFDSPEDYAAALDREFVASVRFAVNRGMGGPSSAVVWMGPWALQQSKVATELLPSMNHPRLMAFDKAAKSLISSWNVPYISMVHMTLPRPDLSKDGTHYSWPVSMAMLELWLGAACPAPSGPARQDC
eukprot:TRINITY_DN50127_c0_g1_i1.p1 TRINITY_DN50127_c0_g1~~TRINITY_DN50127_c0_g1_i1.p1  ORF type:complete len:638 (-),score=-15.91 TRINITY_DN50127_c0_g1_i1:117-2030(-)